MNRNHAITTASILCALLTAQGCLKDETLDTNRVPIARAKAVGNNGEVVDATADGGVPASGIWNQTPALDPKNVARPKVLLPMGTHTFTLWVTDDAGAVSVPSTITIKVGGDPVQECIDGAAPELDDGCKQCLCTQEGASGDTCHTAVPGCDAACWGLIGCIGAMCPTFTMDMDTACVITNCSAFLGGMTGAMAAGSCITPCVAECTPSLTAIVTAGG